MNRRGTFVTFEGPEGSGKSTHASRLAERLRGLGREVVEAREPGGTPTGEAIRHILQHDRVGEQLTPEAETLLFAASRAQLVREVILPALARGASVVCDRFADSTAAYQGYGRALGVDAILAINTFAVDGAVPDLTILLDLDVARGFERMEARNRERRSGRDRIEREALAFHERMRAGYLELARREPRRFCVLNADRPTDVVADDVWTVVASRLEGAP